MPSETASRASPRYLRTFDPCSISLSSRQSRIASAISVGVSSSSPAPSATAFTNAIAFRIRSAAARPAMGSAALGLARSDHDAAIRLFADARAADVRVVLQCEMDGAPLEGLHGVERDGVARHLHLASGAQRDLAHRVLAALAIALDVDDDSFALAKLLAEHDIRHGLQRAQRLSAPADQRTEVAAADVDGDGVGGRAHGDLCPHAHVLEQPLDERTRRLRLPIGGGRAADRVRSQMVDDGDLDHRLPRALADHTHVHVAAALAKLDPRDVYGFVESATATFS